MLKKISVFCGIAFLFIGGGLFVTEASAQCGTYFKTKYRAINKINYGTGTLFAGPFSLFDWTGDGRPDFWNFQTNTSNSTSNVLIYPSQAGGYWDWNNPIVYSTPLPGGGNSTLANSAIRDFDFDGDPDFLYADRVYRNNADGSFTALAPITGIENPIKRIGFYDLNGDNRLDLVDQVNEPGQGNSIVYYPGNADGTFAQRVTIFSGPELLNLADKFVADFNGDGDLDIVYFAAVGQYRYLQNTGSGNFTAGSPTAAANGVTGFFGARDLNNDSRADLAALGGAPRKLVVFYGQANGTFTETAQNVAAPALPNLPPKLVELNGDNNIDIIEYGETSYNVFLNNGAGSFTETTYQRPLGWGNGDVAGLVFADYSGDGKADIYDSAYTSYNMFGEHVLLIKENQCQSFGETRQARFADPPLPNLVTWNPNSGTWRIGVPTSVISNSIGQVITNNWGLGSLGDVPAPGDFDGDGKTDYAVYRNSEGNWYVLQSSNGAYVVFRFGLPGDVAVPNDYDGGGKTDFAVFRPSTGIWYFWFNETQSFGAVQFGASGDKPVPADYDGDGKWDAAVYRPSNGNWYFLRSTDLGYGVVNWGLANDKPLPADYDGDGKADFAVYRDGTWFILRSYDLSFSQIQFGSATDLPMPMYWRNNDFADIFVYRASNNFWYHYYAMSPPNAGIAFGQANYTPVYFGLPNN